MEFVRKPETTAQRLKRLTGKASPQHAFNCLLWDIIRSKGGKMVVSGETLRRIPNDMTLTGVWDDSTQSLIIEAVVKKGMILAPADNGIIIN